MVDDSAKLKRLFLKALEEAPDVSQADIARVCDVSDQAVNGWKKTGRIDKKHFPALAKLLRKPLGYWHGEAVPAIEAMPAVDGDLRVRESATAGYLPSHVAGLDVEILRRSLDHLESIYASHGREFDPREEADVLAFAYDWLANPSPSRSAADFGRALADRARRKAEANDGREDDRAGQHDRGQAQAAAPGKARSKARRT